jgi:hypothetical protein
MCREFIAVNNVQIALTRTEVRHYTVLYMLKNLQKCENTLLEKIQGHIFKCFTSLCYAPS